MDEWMIERTTEYETRNEMNFPIEEKHLAAPIPSLVFIRNNFVFFSSFHLIGASLHHSDTNELWI